MERNLAAEYSTKKLAEKAGVSKYQLNRLFKQCIGLSPLEYQVSLRLHRAKQLLRETNLDIAVIANEVGYSNADDFIKLFRRVSDMKPSDYRK